MLKFIDARVHGVLDYALAAAFIFAPGVLGFGPDAANLSRIIGIAYLGASLLTKYPLGALKLIPFPVHGLLEALMAASWLAVPWIFGFAADAAARNFYLAAGAGLLAVVAFTDYRSTPAGSHYAGHERRHRLIDRRQRSLAIARDRRAGLSDRRRYASA